MSWNVEGLEKHLETVAKLADNIKPDLILLQETKAHQLEEADLCNKLGT